MLRHVFLIDVSKHIGLVQHVVNAAQAYASEFHPELTEWFAKSSQVANFGVDAALVHHVTYGVSPWLSIKARIDELSGNGFSDRVFHVLSYDGQVLGAAAKLSSPTLAISSFSLGTLSKAPKTGEPVPIVESITRPMGSSPAVRPIPVADAIELTKKLLADRGYDSPENALKQLFLRRLLSDNDPRARKNRYDPASFLLISNIVNDGLAKGWLRRSRRDDQPGTERIWLVRQETPNVTVEATASASSDVSAGARSVRADVLQPASATVVEKGHERTVQMQTRLKDRYMYSPKLIRDYIFAALRAGMGSLSTKPVTVSQFVREASAKAEEKAKGEGVKYEFWPKASDGVLENLVAAGALLDEHKAAIKPGAQARGTKVYELQADFEDCCEAYLLEYLITALGDVTWPRDRTAIAHALFKVGPSRKEVYELQEKVDELLVRLRDRVVEKENGRLVVEKA